MQLTNSFHAPIKGWRSALPDLIGCVIALLMAWWLNWRTADLIWSLWLASLVIGYSYIVWQLFGTSIMVLFRHGDELGQAVAESPGRASAGLGLILIGKLFLLAFFTVHFGGFHWGHSIFVNSFFPISPDATNQSLEPALADYWIVVKTYAWFIPLALFAQRGMFKLPETHSAKNSGGRLVSMKERRKDGNLKSTAEQRRRTASKTGPDMGAAYKNVIRLHLLIFFLFGAHAIELPDFVSYAVVYLVYFFPWKSVFGENKESI